MSESDIYGWLKLHEDFREVVRSIETTPKKASEIAEHTNLSLDRVASILNSLEGCGAVKYVDYKWIATDIGIKVLKKFWN